MFAASVGDTTVATVLVVLKSIKKLRGSKAKARSTQKIDGELQQNKILVPYGSCVFLEILHYGLLYDRVRSIITSLKMVNQSEHFKFEETV